LKLRGLLPASALLACVVLLGRLTGFLREVQIAALFGLSSTADFAVLLLTTPDLLFNLLLAGGLRAILVPEFRFLPGPARSRLFMTVAAVIIGVFGLVAVCIAVFPELLVIPLAPGYASTEIARLPFAIMALAVPLAGLAGLTACFLNSQGRFLIAGSGTLVFNLTLSAVLFVLVSSMGPLVALSIAIAAAAAARFISQLAVSMPLLESPAPTGSVSTPGILLGFAKAMGATTLILLVPIIMRSAMSFGGEGAIAAFNYGMKLPEMLTIVGSSIVTVAFTRLSGHLAAGDEAQAGQVYSSASVVTFMVGLAICIPGIWFAHPLVDLAFGRGQMTAQDVELVAELASIGMLTIPLVATSGLGIAMLNAHKRPGAVLVRTLFSLMVVPIALIPGLLVGDPRIAMAALPGFHLVLAVLVSLAAGLRIPVPALRMAAWRLLGLLLLFAAIFAVDYWLQLHTIFRVGLALAAIVAALLLSGARSALASLRL
jgi:putative peptidoglycan lipid II flippase